MASGRERDSPATVSIANSVDCDITIKGLACILIAIVCPHIFCPRNNWCSQMNNTFGTAIRFRCNFGYKQSGAAIRVCQTDGRWSGEEVRCIRKIYPSCCVHSGTVTANVRVSGERGCGQDFHSPTGNFVSPLYPRPYGNDMYCVWQLHCDEKVHVTLTVDEFNTHPSRDVMEIHDGSRKGSPIIARLSGHAHLLPVTTTSCDMFVTFSSDYAIRRRGFSAHFEPTECGGTFHDSHGVIKTQRYPGARSSDCYWLVVAPKRGLRLSFISYRFDQEDYCNIRDGITKDSQTLCQLDRNSHPSTIDTNSTHIWIHFHSSNVSSESGFEVIFSEGMDVHLYTCLHIMLCHCSQFINMSKNKTLIVPLHSLLVI